MANSSADSAPGQQHHLSINPPHQIFKDVQGSDNTIPLSPQWLISKTGESKTGMGTREGQVLQHPYGSRPDAVKSAGNGEETPDTMKKKDVFRPSLFEMESGRRDRWRDEERDTLSSVRKGWRNGDKEFSDSKKMDKWDTGARQHSGDSRRGPSDWWTDSGNKDAGNDQRRESKWNSRWGPDDKETEIARNRRDESGKDGEIVREKGLAFPSGLGKEEREGDHYKPWRPSQSRGRGESLHNQSTPNKQVPVFSHSRGRGENTSTFSAGRGRFNSGGSLISNVSTQSYPSGTAFDRGESGHGESSHLKYSRMKLVDVYRMADTESINTFPAGFIEVPSLTSEKPWEPLVLCAPDSDEVTILKAIDQGDMVSSGAPQISKDGPPGRNPADLSQSRRIRPAGSREDMSHIADESKDENAETSKTYIDKFRREGFREGSAISRKADEVSVSRDLKELSMQENNQVQSVSPWRPPSVGERSSRISHDWNGSSADSRMKNSDNAWAQPKDAINPSGRNAMNLPHSKGESRWQFNEDPVLRRQPSTVFDREQEARKLVPSSPEELSLYYKDPQGQVQGPFSGTDIIGWFEAGYFGIDLLVRLANAPKDSPFSMLGDVMPHLRAKSGPPPGFTGAKPNDFVDVAARPTFPGLAKVHPGVNEVDMMRNDPRFNTHVSPTEAENRFIESLMAGGLNNVGQGVQGFAANNSSVGPSLPGVDGGADIYLLAKKLALERQRSIPSPYSFWSGRDAANVIPGSEGVSDPARQPSHSPSADLMSILQGADRSSPAVNNPLPAWPQNKVDLPHPQSFQTQSSFGIQQQRPQEQNPHLAGLLGQTIENNSAGMLSPEMMIASGLPQDPHSLNLLQQQLLLQLNSQTPHPSQQQQLLLLEKIMMLKHQRKQEEQQQLLWQQQQLLSQVLSEQQISQQRLGDPSYGQLQPSFDVLRAQIGQQVHAPVAQEERNLNLTKFPPVTHDMSQNVASSGLSSMHQQHQMFGQVNPTISQGIGISHQIHEKELQAASAACERTKSDYNAPPNVEEKSEQSNQNNGDASLANPVVSRNQGALSTTVAPEMCETALPKDNVKVLDVQQEVTSTDPSVETPAPEAKSIEVRENRKTSEKKSKKNRASKQSSDSAKTSSKASLPETKQSEIGIADAAETKSKDTKLADISMEKTDSQPAKTDADSVGGEFSAKEFSKQNTQAQQGRAWKPAPGFKPKSLLEIQMEEQRRAQAEAALPKAPPAPVSSAGLASPWAGIVASTDSRLPVEAHGESSIPEASVRKPEKVAAQGKKSHLHDLLAEEVLAKSKEKEREEEKLLAQVTITQSEPVDDDNFIEAKESKRSRKKSAKAKNSGAKTATLTPVVDTTVPVGSIDKGKSSRAGQQEKEKEVLLPIPSGPSLGDFVIWKGEAVTNPSPAAPAWSTDSKKSAKPASLRDILREQEKSTSSQPPIPVPASQKSQPSHTVQTSGLSWSLSASSPSKTQIHSQVSAQSKHKGDDDLFWGPIEQSTQQSKQGDFPQLSSQKSWGTKTTPGKSNTSSSLNRQKSVTAASADRLSSSPAVSQPLKGKKGAVIANTEANDFRDWCRSECLRLLGSEDTSVLEFCLKLPRSEAETLLTENLGTFDRDHKFIDKFLNYKDFLPSEVLEMAFQGVGLSTRDMNSGNTTTAEGFSKAGGKKKGKKGKKVSPAVLGFNVVSNRIMMGEIQTIDD